MGNIVIHANNVDLVLFENWIQLKNSNDIDRYISDEIIPELVANKFDRIFIKDNLSSNYLELIGLRMAYHIRLSKKLEDKRFCPIIILSDLDSHMLNKLDAMARILFTKNIFIISNTKDEIEKFQSKELKNLTEIEYRELFLNNITVEPPKDYTDHHDITNEWAIYQWSNALDLTTNAIEINHNKISSMLYFKYLLVLHEMNDDSDEKYEIESSRIKGKILYIDDEWEKGWNDILKAVFDTSPDITFNTFENIDKDSEQDILLKDIEQCILEEKPDVVVLDLRLSKSDHNKIEDIEQYSGIKVFKMIKSINPGIQVIMMTATRQSLILEKLYDYGVLGYIKKEHPDDVSVNTIENINKLFNLVENGLRRRYLKEIWETSQNLITRLEQNPFQQYFEDDDINMVSTNLDGLDSIEYPYSESWNVLKAETRFIFDILNGHMDNKLNYALISLASSLDAIKNIFIACSYNHDSKKNECYYLGEELPDWVKSLNTYMLYIISKTDDKETFQKKEKQLRRLIGARNCYIHHKKQEDCKGIKMPINANDVKQWFNLLDEIIERIEKPKKIF